MNIVGIMAAHQRPEITRETLRLLKERQALPFHEIIVMGGPEEQAVAQSAGCEFLRVPNEPLGRKYQCGLFWSRIYNPDAVTVLGSDAWLSPEWLKESSRLLREGAECVGSLDWHTCCVKPGRPVEILHHQYHPEARKDFAGGGRTYAASLLDRMGWDLFPPAAPRNLDHYCMERVRRAAGKVAPLSDQAAVMGIKGPWPTLNHFEKLKKSPRLVDLGGISSPSTWMDQWFPGGRKALLRAVPQAVWEN